MSYTLFFTISYVTASYFFLKMPTILHKKKKYRSPILNKAIETNKILHISHRGGSFENLENTTLAFDNAVILFLKFLMIIK